ncbi:MAG: hypothetical protein E7066_06500 [Lentimicrobiaceae bacterium]|nr:hypothetical protein [Lentimicrobiaceae bacterium]
MKNKNLLILSVILFLSISVAKAQSIRVLPISSSQINETAASLLYNRLNQVVSLNGIGSTDNSNRFLMISSVSVLSIEATETVPINYVAEVEISIFIVDNSKKLLMSQEIITRKGVADSETKAVQEAIKSIKGRDPKLKKMITVAKDRILDYYNNECETVMQTINTYLEMEMYDEALNELNAIPQIDANLDCYNNSMNILSKISMEQQQSSNNNIRNSTPDVSWVNE